MDIRNNVNLSRQYISSEVRFYTISELIEMLDWSETTVQRLFNDPKFPAANYGKGKVVEVHALIDLFSKRHEKERASYWR